jgi:hypothetical protein
MSKKWIMRKRNRTRVKILVWKESKKVSMLCNGVSMIWDGKSKKGSHEKIYKV